MNDVFYEQFISANKAQKTILLRILTILGTFLACFLCFLFLGFLFFLPAAIIVFVVVYFIRPRLYREYEYSLSNFYFDVATIYNKESRKERLEIDIREAEILAPTKSPRLNSFRPVKTLDFTSGNQNAKTYSFMISINNTLHKIMFEPDETMLQLLKGRMGSRIYMD